MHTSITSFSANTPGYARKEYRLSGITQKKKETGAAQKEPVLYENGRGTVSREEIDQFKESNSPENDKVSQIYGKFRAGKELDYLARYSPEIYQEVKEIMMERKALEMRMKLAKTKLEVNAAITNETVNIKNTMGTGEQAKKNAMKTMARVNQTNDAAIRFKASAEYREKDDEKTQAEDTQARLEEQEELFLEQEEKLLEQAENAKEQAGEIPEQAKEDSGEPEDSVNTEEVSQMDRPQTGKREKPNAVTEEPEVTVKDIAQEEKKAKRRRRQRRSVQDVKDDSGAVNEPVKVVTKEELRRKFEMAGSAGARLDIKL